MLPLDDRNLRQGKNMLLTHFVRARVAVVIVAALVGSPFAPLVSLLEAQAPATPAAAPARTGAPASQVTENWPRAYSTASGAALVLYQPQITSWANQKQLVAYVAMSYTPKGGKKELGTARVEANTSVALDERLVNFSDFRLTETNFPGLQRDQLKTAIAEVTSTIPKEERVIALDRVLANIDTSAIIPKNVEGVKNDPPAIFYSATPAVLLNIDGDPIWSPIPMNDLRSAVNTNWDLFEHGPTKTFYLRNEKIWLKATDVKGPWEFAGKLPDSFKKLPDDENWKDVKLNI
jgi:hypothetical protein